MQVESFFFRKDGEEFGSLLQGLPSTTEFKPSWQNIKDVERALFSLEKGCSYSVVGGKLLDPHRCLLYSRLGIVVPTRSCIED